jgi:hypothetical protein
VTTSIDNPILNSPYEQPDRHYVIGPQGPTGEIRDGGRVSESFIPIAVTKKGKKGPDESEQVEIDFDVTGERRQKNSLINEIRLDVDKWRMGGHYGGVTPITRKLLQHWADPDRENRVIFAQREAAETAIFLTEVAGRHHGYADWRKRLEPENEAHNDGLPRASLKMATGAGKTVVMAMLIAWQTLNKVQSPRDARFTNRFLIVTPGVTIRDRLRVLLPEDPENYSACAACGRYSPVVELRLISRAMVDTARPSSPAIARAERPARTPSAMTTRSSRLRKRGDGSGWSCRLTMEATCMVTPFRCTVRPFFQKWPVLRSIDNRRHASEIDTPWRIRTPKARCLSTIGCRPGLPDPCFADFMATPYRGCSHDRWNLPSNPGEVR